MNLYSWMMNPIACLIFLAITLYVDCILIVYYICWGLSRPWFHVQHCYRHPHGPIVTFIWCITIFLRFVSILILSRRKYGENSTNLSMGGVSANSRCSTCLSDYNHLSISVKSWPISGDIHDQMSPTIPVLHCFVNFWHTQLGCSLYPIHRWCVPGPIACRAPSPSLSTVLFECLKSTEPLGECCTTDL